MTDHRFGSVDQADLVVVSVFVAFVIPAAGDNPHPRVHRIREMRIDVADDEIQTGRGEAHRFDTILVTTPRL